MGNNQSLPEKVLSAVQRNDVCALQALLSNLSPSAGAINNPAARTAVLEYQDKNGRTPLLVAAAKNHYQILQLLIQLGANVHYINPSRDSAGSALHEAAARRHEATVELLLSAGASPFTANAAGRTALEEAVLSGNTGVVRAIEKYAEFSGMVAFKSRTMGGFSWKYKARWAVMMPYFPFGRGREGSSASASASGTQSRSRTELIPKPRRCLWLYKDKFSAAPRCRLWVDGAAVLTNGPGGTEGTLRLHTSHGEPIGDLVASFSHGYCVAFRPADMTPSATSAYHRLVGLLNGSAIPGTRPPPPPQQQQQQQAVAAMSAGPHSAMYYPAAGSFVSTPSSVTQPPVPAIPVPAMLPNTAQPPSSLHPCYPVVLPVAPHGAGAGVSSFVLLSSPPPPPQQVSTSALAVTPPPSSYPGVAQSLVFPGTAGHCPMAPPPTLQTQRQPSPVAARTVPASAHVQSARGDIVDVSAPGVDGQIVGDRIIERMAALPGESDEVFAMRLASAISAASVDNSQRPLHPQKHIRAEASSSSRPAVQASADLSSHSTQRRRSSTGDDVSPSLARTRSDQHNSPVPYSPSFDMAGGERGPSGQSLEVRPAGAVAAGQREQYSTSGAGTSGCDNASFTAHVPPSSCGSKDIEPSAPPVDPLVASTARLASRTPESEPECVICLNAPRPSQMY
ncbi:hypothetical protein Vafri_18994 [Volvox africanus]|uniref:Uncharacterized protein n=1 Tax=Volvox africanus TaxID=51714 RepID=A0A8J4F979_9CHLO|nr:hypothetical protein Vafri_18994 [Volvox africanus]